MRIRTRSLIIMFSQAMAQLATLALGVVLVRLISKHTFGTYRQTFLVYTFVAGALSFQLGNSLYYFLPKVGLDKRRDLLGQTILASLVSASIAAIAMLLGAEPIARAFGNPGLAPLIRILALYPVTEGLQLLVPAFMISLDRATRAAAYSLAAAVGRVGIILTVFVLGYGLSTVMMSMILTSGAVAAVGCADMIRLSPGERWRLDRSLLVDQVRYVWPLWATSVVGILNLQYDKMLISGYFNPSVYAVYSCGAIELPVVALVTVSISHAIMPNLVPMVQADRKSEALLVWQEAARKCSLVIFPVFAFALAVCSDLIVLIYGPDYARAAWPFGIYLCLLPLRVGIYSALLRAFGQTKPIAVGALIGLTVNVVLSTSLVFIGHKSLLSFIGPAIGTVVATFCIGGYLMWRISRGVGVSLAGVMRWKELGLTLLLSAIAALTAFVVPLPELPLMAKISIQAVIFIVVLVPLVWWTHMLHDDEIELLVVPFRLVRRFLAGEQMR